MTRLERKQVAELAHLRRMLNDQRQATEDATMAARAAIADQDSLRVERDDARASCGDLVLEVRILIAAIGKLTRSVK